MKLGMSSVSAIVENYFKSLSDQQSEKKSKKTICAQIALPVCLGAAFGLFGPIIRIYNDAIVGISIVSALLCAMATLLFQTRSDWHFSRKKEVESFVTDKDLELVDQLFAAVMWAILFGLVTTFVMIVVSWLDGAWLDNHIGHIFSGVIIAFVIHFVFVVGLILKRLNRVYDLFARQKR